MHHVTYAVALTVAHGHTVHWLYKLHGGIESGINHRHSRTFINDLKSHPGGRASSNTNFSVVLHRHAPGLIWPWIRSEILEGLTKSITSFKMGRRKRIDALFFWPRVERNNGRVDEVGRYRVGLGRSVC